MRTYEETHPWLTFELNLAEAPPALWLLFGEARSKCGHMAGVPLRPSVEDALQQLFLAKGALATTAIEGNTLSEEEVIRHLEGQLKLPPSRQYLTVEIDNIVTACNEIVQKVEAGESTALSPATIKEYNRQVLVGLDLEKGVVPGRIRDHSVTVGNYRGAPAEDCEYLLGRLCDWLNSSDFKSGDRSELRLVLPIIAAIVAHLYLAWIHPFGDGNGRTARLIELQILFSSGVPMPAAHLLSNHYNQTRTEYYRQLARASQKGGGVISFLTYAVQGFVDGLRAQLDLVRSQQWDVAWRDYVHEAFHDETGSVARRRRNLILDLSDQAEGVPRAKVSQVSPRVAGAYATVTDMTLTRDLIELAKMGLLVKEPSGWRARRESILAFLPRGGLAALEAEQQALQQELALY